MKIYVINLASSTQRMQAISEHLHSLGLAFERVEAVWGQDLSERELADLYSPQANHQRFYRPLSAGEIGCYASHLNVWRAMVDECVPVALVLEDDMELDARMPALLQAMEATQDWDMVKLVGMRPAEAARKWPLIEGFEIGRAHV